ncbi:protein ABHD15-like [Mercenaria mercenaria]|uniref:protein ABHD15-like n=1 Tax=Mercenaria mercenaria TaxID=6596 RepID=UPI00234F198B|nr:protein ABHD15-like [Mercenaria mercenaria]
MLTKCFIASVCKQILKWISLIITNIKNWKLSKDVIPQLHSKESSLTSHLMRRRGLLNRPFRPTFLLCNGYIQTIAGLLYRPLQEYNFQREYLQMPDKGVVALDWFIESTEKLRRNSLIIVIFPRLTGDALSVGRICRLGASKGMRSVVFNRRGHGSSLLTTSCLTSIGDTKDTRTVMEYILHKFPYGRIVGMGIGAGCTTLFSYLGEFGSSAVMKAAINISPSYDNTVGGLHIPKFYEIFLLFYFKLMLLRNWKVLWKALDMKTVILRTWTLKQFEYLLHCKLCGEDTFESFCQRNDPMRDVDDIAVPVLCVNSQDDQVSVKENIPFDIFDMYPNLLLVTVEKGGHCAFYENVQGDSWVEELAINYIQHVSEFVSNSKLR